MSDAENVYGTHAVTALLKTNAESVQQVFFLQGRRDARSQKILALAEKQQLNYEFKTRAELDVLADGGNHQGVVAQCRHQKVVVQDEGFLKKLLAELNQPAFLLILDGVTDPHNLGACLRTADAVGIHAVIAPKDNSASITPVVRKVASGAAEVVPYITVTNLARTMKSLQQEGLWLVGTADGATENLHQASLTGPLAIVMGAEGKGMRRLTKENCDVLIRIPMLGAVSSLNVSVAVGVCAYEALRQRQ